MAKPFDAALKNLVRHHPADWLARLGVLSPEPPEVLDADFSTVTAAADTLIRAGDLVVHIDLQAGPDAGLATRMLLYNVLAHRQTGLPVRSVVVMLRSNAQTAGLSDRVEYEGLSFRYEVVKVWETPAEEWLSAGVGLVPLAVLGRPPAGRTRAQALPEVVDRIVDTAVREAGDRAPEVVTSAFILAGMHNPPDLTRAVFERAKGMIESSAYQILEEWANVKLARDMIRLMGAGKFGEPTPEQDEKLKAIQHLSRLKRLAVRMAKVASWDALLKGR